MKRRHVLAGLVGGTAIAAGGAAAGMYKFRKRYDDVEINIKPLSVYDASKSVDVCIIGSGPAGCTVAKEVAATGKSVLMLESGGSMVSGDSMIKASKLESYSTSGDLNYPLQASRFRALGGTSNIWTGRCPRLLPLDFEGNPLIPGGAWPLSYDDLAPYYDRAEETLHVIGEELVAGHAPRRAPLRKPWWLGDAGYIRDIIEPTGISVNVPPLSQMKAAFFDNSSPLRCATHMLPELSAMENVEVLSNATVTRLVCNDSGEITHALVREVDGVQKEITAKRFVVACGAVETARLLLLSKSTLFPDGLGNTTDQVGRYFMEHPFVSYTAPIPGMKAPDGWEVARTYEFVPQLREKGLGGAIVAFYGKPHLKNKLMVALGIEMAPDENNRITLSADKQDAFGDPGAHLHLAFSRQDQAVFEEGENIINGIYATLGAGEVEKLDDLHWSHHHMGTTRMGDDPDTSVVDPNLKVHGVKNLYIASGAVFASSGSGNPTLTIVALSHRLADYLNELG